MVATANWMNALVSVEGVLRLVVLLVGVVLIIVAYVKGKSKIALIGGIGLLILFLFSCCNISWGFANTPLLKIRQLRAPSAMRTYMIVKSVATFLFGLINLVGLALIVVALWMGGKKKD